MLGQTSVATTGTSKTNPSSRHGTASGSGGSSGMGGYGSGHYLAPTDDAIKRLNLETRNQESTKRGRTQERIEAQVEEFLAGLDKATRSQLSKTQLVKSLEKVNKWSTDNKKYLAAAKTVPKEWLDQDLDPADWSEKKTIPTPAPAPVANATPTTTPTTTAALGSSALAGSSASASSRFPMFSSYAPKQQEVQFLLTGAIYERERAPNAPTPANQDIIGRRAVKMKEWLQRRAGRQMDRDSIRKWIAGTAKNQNLLPEDVLKMYARKRRDLSSNELQALLDMPDSKELSINELLTQYRKEVPLLPKTDEGSSDGSDEEEEEPQPRYRTAQASAPLNQPRATNVTGGSSRPLRTDRDA